MTKQSVKTHRDDEPVFVRHARTVLKRSIRTVSPAPYDRRNVLLVFGCQRSGTTMLQQSLLDHSWRTIILGEYDRRVVSDRQRLNWDSLELVSQRMRELPFELIVAKPLSESHRCIELLDGIGKAKGIWMLRHFLPVANSNINRFGAENGYRDLRILLENNPSNWRGNGPEEVRLRAAELLSTDLSPLDAAATFWWARNSLYMEQNLSTEDRIRVLSYESLLAYPNECLEALSDFIGTQLPLKAMVRNIRSPIPVGAGLRPDVERLCSELLEKFANVPSIGVPCARVYSDSAGR